MTKKGLGKGMLALMDENSSDDSGQQIRLIDIEKIIPNKYQPRRFFNEEHLNELAESIKEKGVIQPVLVSELGGGEYELIAGERRLRAAGIAALEQIPVIIVQYTENEKLEVALIENLQREDLNAVETATAYKEMMNRLEISQEELAKKIGKNRSSVSNTMRILKLPEYVREKILKGDISEGHARVILSLESIDAMIDFTNIIIEQNFSVRQAEAYVRDIKKRKKEKKKNVSRETLEVRSDEMNRFEDRLTRSLGLKVEVKGNEKKGKVEIYYYNEDDLKSLNQWLNSRQNDQDT